MPSERSNEYSPEKPEVSIVIPTYNEKEGIEEQISKILKVLDTAGMFGEVVIVDDDSPDRTWEFCEGLKSKYNLNVLRRVGKRGLSSAVIDGFALAGGDIKGVMDADGSHDAEILPGMIESLRNGECELAVGSRYVPGGGTRDWPLTRQFISRFAVALGTPLTSVKDVTSGFCLFRKDVIEGIDLNPIGWKIVLEIIIKGKYSKLKEFPFIFKDREKGKSKLGRGAVLNYLKHLWDLHQYMQKNGIRRR